jgi:hypothetical protein
MRCPKGGMQLVDIDYRTIKIDRCTACEGVWVDAGELEEISRFDASGIGEFLSIFEYLKSFLTLYAFFFLQGFLYLNG